LNYKSIKHSFLVILIATTVGCASDPSTHSKPTTQTPDTWTTERTEENGPGEMIAGAVAIGIIVPVLIVGGIAEKVFGVWWTEEE